MPPPASPAETARTDELHAFVLEPGRALGLAGTAVSETQERLTTIAAANGADDRDRGAGVAAALCFSAPSGSIRWLLVVLAAGDDQRRRRPSPHAGAAALTPSRSASRLQPPAPAPIEEQTAMGTPTASLVTGVDFVTLPTTDLDRARAFYGDVLGLEPSAVYQRGDAPAMGAEFENGTVTISLIDAAAIGRELSPNAFPIAFHVDDVAAARAALEERGVTFAADTLDTGVCHMASFADPDGNALMLHHRYAPRS